MPEPRQIAVIGATGTVGREIVAQALDASYTVTALARTPSKLDIEHPALRIVQGDVLDPGDVSQTVRGQDAVMVSLGGGLRDTIRSDGTRTVVAAMQAEGVRRLIVQTTLGAGDSRDNLDLFWKWIMFGLLLRGAYNDHNTQEEIVRASGLDWTITRPAAFTDGPHTGDYRHGFGPDAQNLTLKISRADVADLMLRQVTTDATVHQAIGQSY